MPRRRSSCYRQGVLILAGLTDPRDSEWYIHQRRLQKVVIGISALSRCGVLNYILRTQLFLSLSLFGGNYNLFYLLSASEYIMCM
jgi:hypothetical protein